MSKKAMHSTTHLKYARIFLFFVLVFGYLLPMISTTDEDKMIRNTKVLNSNLDRYERAYAGWPHKPPNVEIPPYEELKDNDRANAVIMENLRHLDAKQKRLLEKADRLRRDYGLNGLTGIRNHVARAQQESLIAGHESAAAGNHAATAAEEAQEAEHALDGAGQNQGHGTFQENELGHNGNEMNLGKGTVAQFAWPSDSVPSVSHGHPHGGVAGNSATHSATLVQNQNPNSQTPDVETPVQELIQQSTDLAKETRIVFEVIAAREDYLVKQMEGFKQALRSAIEVIQNMARENKLRYKRWDDAGSMAGSDGSYQACVYVTPPQGIQQELPAPPQGRTAFAPPEELVQEEPPPAPEVTEEQEQGEDFDLNSIYWLKLPQNEEESSLEKVQRVLAETRGNGRDILIIPVQKGFTNEDDLANGFLRAVRPNPAATNSKQSKLKRKRFRLRIRRVL